MHAQACVELVEAMSDAFEGGPEADLPTGPGLLERFTAVWANIIGTMRDPGSLWRLSMEIAAMGDQLPEVRDHLARAQRDGARGLVTFFMGGREEDVPEGTVDTSAAITSRC
ncbi:hypothetical protein [Streptomyces mutabilis]|uniref:hypothetical protein n=1 Tax=Streptomyces mutabilis TaxID=67332 RepID=UPI000694AC4F